MPNQNPQKLYVLVESFSDYDSSWQKNHIASFDKEKVEQFLVNLNAERAEDDRICTVFRDARRAFMDNYVSSTKEPDANENWPRWPSGADARTITEAMRSERQAIKDRNAERDRIREFISSNRDAKWLEAQAELAIELNLDPIKIAERFPNYYGYFSTDKATTFEIEEVDFLPSASYTPEKKSTHKVKP